MTPHKYAKVYGVLMYDAVLNMDDGTPDAAHARKLMLYSSTKPRLVRGEVTGEDVAEMAKCGLPDYRTRWTIKSDTPVYTKGPHGELLGFKDMHLISKHAEAPFVTWQWVPEELAREMCPVDTLDLVELPFEEASASTDAVIARIAELDKAHGLLPKDMPLEKAAEMIHQQYGSEPPQEVMAELLAKLKGDAVTSVLVNSPKAAVQIHDANEQSFVPVGVTDFSDVGFILGGRLTQMTMMRVGALEPPTWKPITAEQNAGLYNLGYRGAWVFAKGMVGETVGDSMVGFTVIDNLPVLCKTADTISPAGNLCVPEQVFTTLGGSLEGVQKLTKDEAQSYNEAHGVRLNAATSIPRTAN